MKKTISSFFLIFGLGITTGIQAGTWTWDNQTDESITIDADFLGCSLTGSCEQPFDLGPKEKRTISKGAYMLSSTRARFASGFKKLSNSFSNIPASFSDVTFTVTVKNGELVMTKASEGGLSKKVQSSFTTAKSKVIDVLKASKDKAERLFNRITAEMGKIRNKIISLTTKKKTLEKQREQQTRQAADAAAQLKTSQELERINGEIRALEQHVKDLQNKGQQEISDIARGQLTEIERLKSQARTLQEKQAADKFYEEAVKQRDAFYKKMGTSAAYYSSGMEKYRSR